MKTRASKKSSLKKITQPGYKISYCLHCLVHSLYNVHIVLRTARLLDPKLEWSEAENFIYGDAKPFIGPDAILDGVFSKFGAEWEYGRVVNLQVFNMDKGMVLATGRYQGKYKKNGATVDAQCAHLWTLKDGKVIKFQQYTDTKQVSEVIKKYLKYSLATL